MKKIKYIRTLAGVLFILGCVIALSSCGSNSEGPGGGNTPPPDTSDTHPTDTTGGGHNNQTGMVYMPQSKQNPVSRSIALRYENQILKYSAAYEGENPPDHDISVEFSVNSALVNSFNKEYGLSYVILPQKSYELSKKQATIPAGKMKTSNMDLKLITPAKYLDANTTYLLPITVKVNNSNGVSVDKDKQTTFFVIKALYQPYSTSDWKVTDFDSYAIGESSFPASNAIDNDDDTFWNTPWADSVRADKNNKNAISLPHYFTVNMGKSHEISGFKIVGRPTALKILLIQNPKDITIKFSDDGNTWRDSEDFTLPFTDDEDSPVTTKRIFLSNPPVKAQYFKFIITSNVGTTTQISQLNEIHVF